MTTTPVLPPQSLTAPWHYYGAAPVSAPVGPVVKAYIDGVAQRLRADEVRAGQLWIDPLWAFGGAVRLGTRGSTRELLLAVAAVERVTLAAAEDFPRRVREFARRAVAGTGRGGALSVAVLVSERVHPEAPSRVTATARWGAGVLPVVVDLGARQLTVAANTPVSGFRTFGQLRRQAWHYLPDPHRIPS
ncbi:hypothetical protein [Nocardia sp. NPDC052566]|uniref:hypothetical protein n=1 Tax=Nocardia sp. NPDC052566 TaxID=3364330 RepID=UPI0037CA60F5